MPSSPPPLDPPHGLSQICVTDTRCVVLPAGTEQTGALLSLGRRVLGGGGGGVDVGLLL